MIRELIKEEFGSPQYSAKCKILESALYATPNAVVMTDREGTIAWVNPAFTKLTGYADHEVLGENPRILRSGEHSDDFYEDLWATIISGQVWQGEIINRRKDGTSYKEEQTITPVLDDTGEISHFIAIKQDISERKRLEKESLEAADRLRLAVQSSNVGLWDWSIPTNQVDFSPEWKRQLGYEPDEIGSDFSEWETRVHPDDLAAALEHVNRYLARPEGYYEVEFRMRHKDGSWRSIYAHGEAFLDAAGKPRRMVGCHVDLTERKQIERALIESEERYRDLVENATDIIYTHDLECNYTSVNKAVETILGYTAEDSLEMNVVDIVAPEFLEKARQMIADKLAGKDVTAYELDVIAKDGRRVSVEVNTRLINENGFTAGIQGIARDITLRKRTEAERKVIFEITRGAATTTNLDEFLQLAHKSIGELVYAENCFVMLHDPATNLNHFEFWADKYDPPPPPRLASKGFSSYVLRMGRPLLLTKATTKGMIERGEVELVGTASPSWLGVPLRTPSRTIGVLVLQHYEEENAYSERDVEFLSSVGDQIALAIERKRAEEALIESEKRYRDLVENARDIIYTHDFDGNYTSANKAVEDVLGYTVDEAVTRNLSTTVAPEYLGTTVKMMADLLAHEETPVTELEVFAKDGGRVTIEVNARLLKENGRPVGVQGIARDVTERRNLEEQLRQSLKLEAVGQLAGGIAHDFNNLLTAITGYSQLSLRKLPADEPVRANVEEIAKAGERAAALTRQLLAFSRKQVLTPTVHNLNSVILEIEKMLRRLIRENIELRTVLDPELGNIKADPGQIEQVIVNLTVNARDAMPKGGTVTIETQNVYLDMDYVKEHISVEPGHYIKMTVTDTGGGMDEKTRSRIFEPFFTTKAVGSGTGLGLSTVHGIISQSGGDIQVYSELGHGTTFKVYLPCVDEDVQRPRWRDEITEDLSGTETILLVEDEEVVRGLVREILTEKGYTVLEASSGADALSIWSMSAEPIDLLFTDVVMPKMSGDELRAQIIELSPDIKVLFMSGYTDESVAHRGIIESNAPFIEKPFTPDALARKVREVLRS